MEIPDRVLEQIKARKGWDVRMAYTFDLASRFTVYPILLYHPRQDAYQVIVVVEPRDGKPHLAFAEMRFPGSYAEVYPETPPELRPELDLSAAALTVVYDLAEKAGFRLCDREIRGSLPPQLRRWWWPYKSR